MVTTVVSMARAVRKAFRESYVDRCGPLGVQLCTKYRLLVFLLHSLYLDKLAHEVDVIRLEKQMTGVYYITV